MAGLRIGPYKSTQAQLDRARAYRLANPDKAKAARLAWVAKNRDYLSSDERKKRQREYHRQWRVKNREGIRKNSSEYTKNNKDLIRRLQKKHQLTETYLATRWRLHLRRKYKITVEKYNAMLEKQKGVCKICELPCQSTRRGSGKGKKIAPLVVDHDHDTGNIRGLLCVTCNSGLGHFKDSPDLLIKASAYIKGGIVGCH